MFKFDFQQNDEDLNDFGGIDENGLINNFTERHFTYSITFDCILEFAIGSHSDNETAPCNDFEEIQAKPNQIHRSIISNVIYGSMSFGAENEVRYVRMDAEEEQLLGIKGDHTDLIPGVYEGSVKYCFIE